MTPSSLVQKASGRAQALRAVAPPTAGDLIDLSGEFPVGSTAEAVRQAAVHAVERHLCDHYTRRPGIAPLCRAVASSLTAEGVPLGENDVVIAGSPDEARYVAARALAPGRPVYALGALPLSLATGLRFAGVEPTQLAPDGLLDDLLADAQGGLLLVVNPDPATAQVLDPAGLLRVAAWAAAGDLQVIADETGVFVHGEFLRARFAALPGMAARTLTLGAYGDASGLAAWQISWFAGPKSVLTPVRDLKQSITICTSAPSQYAALAALDSAGHDAAAQYNERQEAIAAALEHRHIPFWEPHTAAYLVVDVAAVGGADAAAAACRRAGLIVGTDAALPDRIRIATPATDLGEVLARLESALDELSKRG